ncbi:MAG: peptide deformylase [bacterium]|nr:peptide deformylase [bacterium]
MAEILQKEDPVLRKTAKEVSLEDIGSKKIDKILAEMTGTLESCEDGVALAAPQIGESIRVFVVSPRAFQISRNEEVKDGLKKEADKLIYINPVITKRSVRKVTLDEGCLSVRHIFGKIKRHQKVTIEAYDENGQKFIRGASGLLAEIFQHETDHLNGILFIDSAEDLIKMMEKKTEHVK